MRRSSSSWKVALAVTIMVLSVPPCFAEIGLEPLVRPLRQEASERISAVQLGKGLSSEMVHPEACVVQNINCNSTRTGSLTADDCLLNDGTHIDFWQFQGNVGTIVTINLSSNAFDTYALLLNPTPETVAEDDDSGSGTNSRIVYTIDTPGDWAIGANSYDPAFGPYTVQLSCNSGPSVPAAPSNLTATAISSSEIDLGWRDNSSNETGFRIESRFPGGTFTEIGTVSANSTGASVTNLSSATPYEFRVRAWNSSGNSNYSNIASATTQGGGGSGPCIASTTVSCLLDDRFKVTGTMTKGSTGEVFPMKVMTFDGTRAESNSTVFFESFITGGVEYVFKILDACSFSNAYWGFLSGTLTNQETSFLVEDTLSGQTRTYTNSDGQVATGFQNTSFFQTCNY